MGNKLSTEILINLAGNLEAKAQRYGQSMSRFAQKNQAAMGLIRSTTKAAGRGIDKLGNRYMALGTTLGVGAAIKSTADFDAAMIRMGTNAQLTDKKVAELSAKIREVAGHPDIRVDYKSLGEGVDALLGLTGNAEFVEGNMENLGMVMQAFGTDAKSSAALLAQFYEKGVTGSKEVNQLLDQLYGQFAKGSVGVDEIARVAPKLFSIIQQKGPESIAQMGALIQMFVKTKGSAEESVTSIAAVFASFKNKKKVEFLDKQGIKVFKEGTKELREPVELLMEILETAQNDPLKLGDVFDDTSMQGLASLYSSENKALLQSLIDKTYELGTTQQASAKNAQALGSTVTFLRGELDRFANAKLATPLAELKEALDLDPDAVQKWLEMGLNIAKVGAGLAVAKKVWDVGSGAKSIYDSLKKKKSNNPLSGGAKDLGAMPVYVVNMPANGINATTDEVESQRRNNKDRNNKRRNNKRRNQRTPGRRTRSDGRFKLRGTKDLALRTTDLAMDSRSAPPKPARTQTQTRPKPRTKPRPKPRTRTRPRISGGTKLRGMGGVALGAATMAINGDLNRATAVELAASTAGGAIGATLGSVVPVVGTAIGGMLGSFLGSKLGELANNWLDEDEVTPLPNPPATPAVQANTPPQPMALQVDVHDKRVNVKQVGVAAAPGQSVDMGISLPS